MSLEKLSSALLLAATLLFLTPIIAFGEAEEVSDAIVRFEQGDLLITNSATFSVPTFDFGVHQLRPGRYILPALPSTQEAFGGLPLDPEGNVLFNAIEDITLATSANLDDRAHILEVQDWRGAVNPPLPGSTDPVPGWHISVGRTEFFTSAAWTAAGGTVPIPVTSGPGTASNFLAGAELAFSNIQTFPVGGGVSPGIITGAGMPQATQYLLVPVLNQSTGPAAFMSADATQGMGIHRIQFGNRIPAADVMTARNTDVQLLIPVGAEVQATSYRARLTWTLAAGPGAGVAPSTSLPIWAQ